MSFYNNVMNEGQKINGDIMNMLAPIAVDRIRDCGVNKKENYIWVLTRTGGDNRPDFNNDMLTKHPLYIKDHDEKFDSTYAIYYFNVPPGKSVDQFKHHDIPDLKKQVDEAVKRAEQGHIPPQIKAIFESIGISIEDAMKKGQGK